FSLFATGRPAIRGSALEEQGATAIKAIVSRDARSFLWAALLVVFSTATPRSAAGGVPLDADLQLVATVADQVVHIANSGVPGDDRLFLVRKRGIVQILDGGSVVATPFLDIDSIVINPGSI